MSISCYFYFFALVVVVRNSKQRQNRKVQQSPGWRNSKKKRKKKKRKAVETLKICQIVFFFFSDRFFDKFSDFKTLSLSSNKGPFRAVNYRKRFLFFNPCFVEIHIYCTDTRSSRNAFVLKRKMNLKNKIK